jgi:TctA family transporter
VIVLRRPQSPPNVDTVTTATDHPHSWLDVRAIRTASDIALGCVLLVAGAIAILSAPASSSVRRGELDAGFFPTVVSGLLLAVGIVLLVRGSFFGGPRPGRWSLKGLAMIAAAIIAVAAAAWAWGFELLLRFGPPEYAALIVLGLAVAVTLACRSRIQAAGMALLGLLLATVGLDTITGVPRFTMDLEQLFDGIGSPVVCLGLFVVGDGLACLASPSLWLATYARLVDGRSARRLPTIAAIGMRVAAALAIAAACYLAFELEHRIWDIGLLLLFGAFGLAGKLFGWNRLLLLVALVYGSVLEQSIRQSMLLSQGDLAVFWGRPFSATLLLLAGVVVVLAVLLSARRVLSRWNERAAEGAP